MRNEHKCKTAHSISACVADGALCTIYWYIQCPPMWVIVHLSTSYLYIQCPPVCHGALCPAYWYIQWRADAWWFYGPTSWIGCVPRVRSVIWVHAQGKILDLDTPIMPFIETTKSVVNATKNDACVKFDVHYFKALSREGSAPFLAVTPTTYIYGRN